MKLRWSGSESAPEVACQAALQAWRQGMDEVGSVPYPIERADLPPIPAGIADSASSRFPKRWRRLPWFILIGGEGSGKTTFLRHVGLIYRHQHPKLQETDMQFWVAQSGLVVDTPGQWLDGRIDQAAVAWQLAFSKLRKWRRRQNPMDGILLAISVKQLQQPSPLQDIAALQRVLNQLQQLNQAPLPVYVLITHCDELVGFLDFFGAMNRDQRSQMLGVTLPATTTTTDSPALWKVGLTKLQQDLQQRLLGLLQAEPILRRRGGIARFPVSFSELEQGIARWITPLLEGEQAALLCLRGIYFTSGTQSAQVASRTGSAAAIATGTPEASGRAYFLHDLLHTQIFSEHSKIASLTQARGQADQGWRNALGKAGLVMGTLMVILMTLGFRQGAASVQQVNALVNDLEISAQRHAHSELPTRYLPILNDLSRLQDRLQQTFWQDRLGMGVSPAMLEQVRLFEAQLLSEQLLPDLHVQLLAWMRQAEDPQALLQALDVYRNLTEPANFDAGSVRAGLLQLTGADLSSSELSDWLQWLDQLLQQHMRFLAQDRAAYMTALHRLAQIPVATWINMESARLAELQGHTDSFPAPGSAMESLLLGVKPLPWVLTQAGETQAWADSRGHLHDKVAKLLSSTEQSSNENSNGSQSSEGWNLQFQVQRQQAWQTLGRALRLPHMATLADILALPETWMNPDRLTQAFHELLSHLPKALLESDQDWSGLAQWSVRIDQTSGRPAPAALAANLSSLVEGLRELSDPGKDKKQAWDWVVDAATGAPDSLLNQLHVQAQSCPADLRQSLEQLLVALEQPLAAAAQDYLNAQYQSQVVDPFHSGLQGRYPLQRDAVLDARLVDFTAFYQPDGVMDRFEQQWLTLWHDAETTDQSHYAMPVIAPKVLEAFALARQIRRVYFDGQGNLNVPFFLRSAQIDAHLSRVELNYYGKQMLFQHQDSDDPGKGLPGSKASPSRWPGSTEQPVVQLFMEDYYGYRLMDGTQGDWAWMRLLQQYPQRPGQDGQAIYAIQIQESQTLLEIHPENAVQAFSLRLLSQFRLPDTLSGGS
jgi:type VI secretion system protein ImpL